MLLAVWFMLLLSASLVWGQFPAVCNTPDNLNAKECCPNDCSGRGNCDNITDKVMMSWDAANQSVVEILRNGPINENCHSMYDTSGLYASLKEFATAVRDGEATIAVGAILATSQAEIGAWKQLKISF